MKKIFINPDQVRDMMIELPAEESNHVINALRHQAGDRLLASDQKTEYETVIDRVVDGRAILKIISSRPVEATGVQVRLMQGLCKGDKMDWIIQKATELGVMEIVPLATRRSVVKLDDQKASKKTERWQKIATAAAEQSGSAVIPVISGVLTLPLAAKQITDDELFLVFWEEAPPGTLHGILAQATHNKITICIGPEGGFDAGEIALLQASGATVASLGRQILRTETAAIAATVCVMYQNHNLG